MKLFQITACDRNCMSILNFYDKKRITITCSKTFFKNVLKNDISRCAKKAQKSFKKGYLTMLEEPAAHAGTAQTRISGCDTLSPGSRMNLASAAPAVIGFARSGLRFCAQCMASSTVPDWLKKVSGTLRHQDFAVFSDASKVPDTFFNAVSCTKS